MKKRAIAAAILLSLVTGCGPAEDKKAAAPTGAGTPAVHWRMTSTYPSNLFLIGTLAKRLRDTVAKISDGKLDLKLYEPGVLAPPFETFDAVSYGAVEAGWSTPGYWAGKEPALQLFASVPFGPPAREYLAWFDYGGGKEMFEAIYHKHNIHSIMCGLEPPEASGWFKKEIKTLDDFKGLKIRFFGLGGKVMEEVGAAPQLIAGGEIYQALELGTIDASEYSMPAIDEKLGLYEVAKHYYFPGWHQQSTFFDLMINLKAWNTLNDVQKAQIETACSSNIRYGISEGEAKQVAALARLKAKGVEIHTWSPEVLAGLHTAWDKVAADMAKSDPTFAKAWTSLQEFRKSYRTWSERGYLKE